MGLHGSNRGLLDDLHAPDCAGTEYSTCRPIVTGEPTLPHEYIVVRMVWCESCGAAEYEEVA